MPVMQNLKPTRIDNIPLTKGYPTSLACKYTTKFNLPKSGGVPLSCQVVTWVGATGIRPVPIEAAEPMELLALFQGRSHGLIINCLAHDAPLVACAALHPQHIGSCGAPPCHAPQAQCFEKTRLVPTSLQYNSCTFIQAECFRGLGGFIVQVRFCPRCASM
jgi:hypothetical protein